MRRRKSSSPIIVGSAVVALVVAASVAAVATRNSLVPPLPRVAEEPDHVEREAVRAWLRENTNTGEWEEVRWYDSNRSGDNNEYAELRLKYRTDNDEGATQLFDRIFWYRPDEPIEAWTLKQSSKWADIKFGR